MFYGESNPPNPIIGDVIDFKESRQNQQQLREKDAFDSPPTTTFIKTELIPHPLFPPCSVQGGC